MANGTNQVTGWVGWVYFAGFLMMVSGLFHMIAGFTALLNSEYYLVTSESLLVFDFTTWGWVHLLMGLVVMLAGTAVLNGQMWARVIGVLMAVVAMLASFTFMAAYPFWAITFMVVNVLIIYALTVHGAEARE